MGWPYRDPVRLEVAVDHFSRRLVWLEPDKRLPLEFLDTDSFAACQAMGPADATHHHPSLKNGSTCSPMRLAGNDTNPKSASPLSTAVYTCGDRR